MERLILTADEDDEGTSQTPLIPPKSPARSLFELKSPFDFDALWTRGSEGRGSDGTGERGKQQTGTDWGGSDNILRPSLRNAGLSLTQQPLSSRRQVQPLTFPSLRESPSPKQNIRTNLPSGNPTSPTQRPAPSPEATPRNLPPPAARPSMTEQNSSGRYPPEYIQFLIEEHAARKAGGGGRRRGGGVGIMVG